MKCIGKGVEDFSRLEKKGQTNVRVMYVQVILSPAPALEDLQKNPITCNDI